MGVGGKGRSGRYKGMCGRITTVFIVGVFVVVVVVLGREIEGDVREGHRACLR